MLLPNEWRLATGKATVMLLGYARVSKSEDQQTAPQIRALKQAGCKKIFEETASGGRWDRPELHRLLDQFRAGDTLVVWKLDRRSRSLKDLLVILERLEATGEMIRERTRAGIREAQTQGRVPGRKPKITAEQRKEIVDAVSSGRKTAAEMARLFKIHRGTISRFISKARGDEKAASRPA